MIAQSRRASLAESMQNLGIGFAINAIASWFGIHSVDVRAWSGFAVFVAFMSVISVVRSYGLRRFNEWRRRRRQVPEFEYIVEEIAAKRRHQIETRGYSIVKDDEAPDWYLPRLAAAYAILGGEQSAEHRYRMLPGDICGQPTLLYLTMHGEVTAITPTNQRDELISSAACIIAAIGRLDRAQRKERNAPIQTSAVKMRQPTIGDCV